MDRICYGWRKRRFNQARLYHLCVSQAYQGWQYEEHTIPWFSSYLCFATYKQREGQGDDERHLGVVRSQWL